MKLFLEQREENMEWFLGERINCNQFWAISEEFHSVKIKKSINRLFTSVCEIDCLTDWKKSSEITRI